MASCMAICAGHLHAQEPYNFNNPAMRAITDDESTPGWVTIGSDLELPAASFWMEHGTAFGLNADNMMQVVALDSGSVKYQQLYKGVEVEYMVVRLHVIGDHVRKVTGRLVPNLDMAVAPSWTLADAQEEAIAAVDADVYMWDDTMAENELKEILQDPNATYYPEGKLVLTALADSNIEEPGNYRLAWSFDIYAQQPVSGQKVFVDALNGSIIKTEPLITNCMPKHEHPNTAAHAPAPAATHQASMMPPNCHIGMACTLYDGIQSITTELRNPPQGYRLYDACRPFAVYTKFDGYSTYNYDANNNNNWNAHCPAVSAHWATEKFYDYFLQKHGRLGYANDNNRLMYNNVYSTGCDNASWNGYFATFDNGCILANNYLVSLDVVGHEWTHAVTKFSAGLVYSKEPGALNESFSDIFGTMLDYFAGTGDYLLGEDMWIANGKVRDMSDPNSKSHPDTYGSPTFWVSQACSPNMNNDYCGVHTNSGVQNYWFYLLSNGGSGTNDFGFTFSVNSIGRDKAAAIAYRNLTVYMTPTSNFADARQGSIEAAKDLFGNCSNEVIQTAAAWDAVGVYRPVTVAANTNACGTFNGNTNPNVFIATQTLRAGNICNSGFTTVDNGGTLVMKAGQSVELYPGYWAKPGSYSHAYIMTCVQGNYLAPPDDEETAIRSTIPDVPVAEVKKSSELTIQPNPFQDFTTLEFTLSEETKVDLMIFDAQGKLVRQEISNEIRGEGAHAVKIESGGLLPGVYFCRLQAGKSVSTRKMVLMR